MSRLATISSTYSIYSNAIKGLAALYIARGYPEEIVLYWTKNNIREKWEKRLNETPRQHEAVLVLKSEFNTAWNYFSASELGSTILDFWRDWMQHAETGKYSILYPEFTSDRADLEATSAGLLSRIQDSQGRVCEHPDVRKLEILSSRMIVSRKRTRNLFDLTNLWKRLVLTKMDQQVLEDNHEAAPVEEDDDVDMDVVNSDSDSSNSDVDPFIQLLRNQGATF